MKKYPDAETQGGPAPILATPPPQADPSAQDADLSVPLPEPSAPAGDAGDGGRPDEGENLPEPPEHDVAAPPPEDGDGRDGEDDEEPDESDDDADDQEAMDEAEDMPPLPLVSVVEALLFAAREPLKPSHIARAVGKRVRQNAIRAAVDELNLFYLENDRAFEIAEVSGRFQLMSRPEYVHHIRRIYPRREAGAAEKKTRLTPTAFETLAIIAYKQPVTRGDIEHIRGVNCDAILRSLIDRGTVKEAGRAENLVGKPRLYTTTDAFLVEFGLASVDELPNRNEFLAGLAEVMPELAPPPPPFPAETANGEEEGGEPADSLRLVDPEPAPPGEEEATPPPEDVAPEVTPGVETEDAPAQAETAGETFPLSEPPAAVAEPEAPPPVPESPEEDEVEEAAEPTGPLPPSAPVGEVETVSGNDDLPDPQHRT